MKPTTHRSNSSRSISIRIFYFRISSIFIFHFFKLTSNKILKIWKSIFCCHFKKQIYIWIFPRKIWSNIVSWDRKSKNSSLSISLYVNFNQSSVYDFHLFFKLSKFLFIVSIFYSSKKKRFILQIFRTSPVQSNICKRSLSSPSTRNI